jgi:hypothetical protein
MIAVRRLLAAAGASALALTLFAVAPPASAQAAPTVEWTRPTMNSTLDEQGPITGTVTGNADQKINSAEFTLERVPPSGDPEDPCLVDLEEQRFQEFDGRPPVDFRLEVNFPCNGAYELTATVSYEQGISLLPPEPVTDSLPFSMALPPERVKGLEAAYDPETREVRLTWAPNPELESELIGYVVERNPPGRIGYSPVGNGPVEGTSFTDTDVGDENRYRIIAVRKGPTNGSQIFGEPSLPVTSGPDAPAPAVPAPGPAPSAGNSGAGNRSSGSGDSSRPSSRPRTQDNVFEEALPFDPSRTTRSSPSLSASPPEDAAVLTELDGVSEEEQRRATLLPVAGGLALIVGAMHLLVLSKQAGEADIPIVASRPPGGGRGVSW